MQELKPILTLLFLVFTNVCRAQLSVVVLNDTLTPTRLVKEFLLGENVTVTNVRYRGELDAMGAFTDPDSLTGFKSGIILSNGRSDLLPGKNSRPNAGANFGRHFFVDEDFVTREDMCDGAVLEFDFVPAFDSVAFRFVFGSEEYPEFVGKQFNDVFALLVKSKTPKSKYKNIGTLPDGTRVAINSVNHKQNSEWYVANDYYTAPFYNLMEYDGLTKPIVAGMKVIPFHTYHIKILIADLGDCEYDSGVLLEAYSFGSYPKPKVPKVAKQVQSVPAKPAPKPVKPIKQNQPAPVIKQTYQFVFATNSSILSESDTKRIQKLCDSLSRFTFEKIEVIGHTDSTGTELGNQTLSQQRAEAVVTQLTMGGVNCMRWVSRGAGSTQPIRTNDTEEGKAANRRVEILFTPKKTIR